MVRYSNDDILSDNQLIQEATKLFYTRTKLGEPY